ncbi:LamG-like jellyroll fold domain-containing protein [Haladaptatus sp. DYSN1]|uniref:LamG-like jellyroll fold domain-containing protein n=1 Tax=unclassified Haladaptatus TaxID=2622732 RepID=UPI002406CD64|nr:LamG-like jellyroll fold domain-containing protein [Haladaptatus sp. DYSN1]
MGNSQNQADHTPDKTESTDGHRSETPSLLTSGKPLPLKRRHYLKTAGVFTAGFIGGGSALLAATSKPAAAAITVIDDYDDGSLAEYTTDDSTAFDLVQSPTHSGGYAFRAKAGNGGSDYAIAMPAQIPQAPQAGDTFEFWFYPEQATSDLHFAIFGAQGDANTKPNSEQYRIRLKSSGDLRFYVHDGTQWTELASSTAAFSIVGWNRIEVQWGLDGTFTITHFDSSGTQTAQLTASDTTWVSGGFGYFLPAASSVDRYYDTWRLLKTTALGRFEHGLNGWTANSTNQCSRVNGAQQPACVSQGEYALKVSVNSDPEPSIETQQATYRADFVNYPCLLADVLPASVENSESAVTFRFRYHHTDPGGVEESPEMTVAQRLGGRIAWDLSGLSATKLASADKLELVWYPEDHPPGSGFDYSGVVYVDNVHLTDNPDDVAVTQMSRKRRALARTYGPCVDTIVQTQTDSLREGTFNHQDGTQVPYRAEILSDESCEVTIDGETFRFHGGSP